MYSFSKPIQLLNQKSYTQNDRDKRYKDDWITSTIVSLIFALLVGCRIGHSVYILSPDHHTFTGMTLDMLEQDILSHPLALFPTSWKWLLISLCVPLVVCINGYQEYIKKKNTMWVDAHGSGGFEKNFAGYYREFVYDPAVIGGATMSIDSGAKKVSTKIDHVSVKNNKEKILYLVDKSLPWTRNNLITPEDVAKCIMNSQLYSNTVMLSMNAKLTQRNLHAIILGASGTGKSRFYIKPNLLQANSSYVVTDPSGENVAATGKFLESQGYIIKIFNLKDMTHSCRYNPFEYIKDSSEIPSLVNCMKNNIDSAGSGKKKDSGANKFWDDSTIALLCSLVAYCYEAFTDDEEFLLDENGNKQPIMDKDGNVMVLRDVLGNPLLDENGDPLIAYEPNPYWKGKRNFKNVMRMIRMSVVDEADPSKVDDLDQLFADWEAAHPQSFAVNQYKTFKLASGKTTREILVSTAVLLGTYFDLDACTNLTYKDEMELYRLGTKQKMAIFIITPENDATMNWLAAMLYTQVFRLLYDKGEEMAKERQSDIVSLEMPVRLLIDEFANIGNIPNLQKILSTSRKYQLHLSLVLQSMAQLSEVVATKEEGQVLLGNADTMLFLGGAGEDTTKSLSAMLGKETVKTYSYGNSYGKQSSMSENRQEIAHDVLSPDEIARMRNDECIIRIRGLKPFCTKKYRYEKHPNYKYTPEGAPENQKAKWTYNVSKFETVYSDDVIAAASVYSPSDPRYDLYRDPAVLLMIAREHDTEVVDISKDVTLDGRPARGPVFFGNRYKARDRSFFLDANNLQKQIADKQRAAQMRMGMGGMGVNPPRTHGGSNVATSAGMSPAEELKDKEIPGVEVSERKRIETVLKNLDKDILLDAETFFKYTNLSDEEIRERYTLEKQFCPDYEFFDDELPSSDVVYDEEDDEEEPDYAVVNMENEEYVPDEDELEVEMEEPDEEDFADFSDEDLPFGKDEDEG